MATHGDDKAVELYRKHRPKRLEDMRGQDTTVAMLNKFLRTDTLPHALLFTGSSGCGKTSAARILQGCLHCSNSDYREVNAASARGIDTIREMRDLARLSPANGNCRIFAIDECHGLTGAAQEAILKLLEDTPNHVYIFLLTTTPRKLVETIKTRCTELKFAALSTSNLQKIIAGVASAEEMEIDEEVVEKIAEVANGSARKALVILHQVSQLDSTEARLDAIRKADSERAAIDIARALLDNRTQWKDLSMILKEVEDEPETIRRIVLGYMNSVILSAGPASAKAFAIATEFRDHWYDIGAVGLTLSCYAIAGKK
jgi:DNA polymerase III gamma/tau subunit